MTDTPRARSSIKFPYGSLADAEAVAQAIWKRGLTCSIDQLAAQLGQNLSGAFRNKVSTAAIFDVVETSRGSVTLTDLGVRLVDPQTNEAARVEAFLQVPLYEQVYDQFRGKRLPEDQGLEAVMVDLGVSKKQAAKARQAMIRSAEQAGFFLTGRDRLVEPPIARVVDPIGEASSGDLPTPSPGLVGTAQHPLIVGLWQMLPDPSAGTLTAQQQEDWLAAAKVNLKLLYGGGAATQTGGSGDAAEKPPVY